MKKSYMFLMGIVFLLMNACQDSYIDGVTMVYEEKKCENPWNALPEQGNYLVEVRGYLEGNEIQVEWISIDVYDENVDAGCTTCNCPTGRNVVIKIPTRDARKAENVGFVLND